jgi:hypothetical protein
MSRTSTSLSERRSPFSKPKVPVERHHRHQRHVLRVEEREVYRGAALVELVDGPVLPLELVLVAARPRDRPDLGNPRVVLCGLRGGERPTLEARHHRGASVVVAPHQPLDERVQVFAAEVLGDVVLDEQGLLGVALHLLDDPRPLDRHGGRG